MFGKVALCISAVCIAPLIAFAVLWTGVLAVLFVMWLWYSGTLIPVSFLMAGFCFYLAHKYAGRSKYVPAHAH